MSDADLPHRLTLPPLDTPLLHWWARDWDRAFFVLSPFFHVPGAHPRAHRYGPTYSDSSIADFLDNPDAFLTAHCDQQALYMPEEDVLPAILEPCLLA